MVSLPGVPLSTGRCPPPPSVKDASRESRKSNVTVRLSMLPEAQAPWKAFGTSAGMQFIALQLLIWVPLLVPQALVPRTHYSVVPLVEAKHVSEWKPQPRPKFKTPPPPVPQETVAKIVTPRLIAPKPQPRKPPVVNTESPSITPRFQPAKFDAAPGPPKPRPEVQTGVLSGGSSAPATLNRPAKEVQTGGFGDPNGVPAVGNGKRAATIAPLGSFDLPPGPGYGNGSGGAKGLRGTVASAGFGNGIAVQGGGGQGGRGQGAVQQGLFSDAARQPVETGRKQTAAETPSVQPLEILSKPDPVYTAEARNLHIEGEVLLQAVFAASGEVRVLRVTRGLGHGLDEAAVAAAGHIRFKPRRENGNPVDSTATVHIVFQLAY